MTSYRAGIFSLCALTLALAAIICTGCRHNRQRPNIPSYELDIHDTIRKGSYTHAVDLIDRRLGTETDSATFYSLVLYKSVAHFYLGDIESSQNNIDAVAAWLQRQPRPLSLRCRYIYSRLEMARGSAVMQYDYRPDSAVNCYRRALEYTLPSDISQRLQLLSNLADTYRLSGNLDLALDSYNQALELADSAKVEAGELMPLLLGSATVMTDLRDFDEQPALFRQIEAQWGKLSNFDKFSYLTALANSRYYRQDYYAAEQALERLDSVLRTVPDSEWECNFNRVNLADAMLRQGKVTTAAPLLDSAETYFTTVQHNDYILDYIATQRLRQAIIEGNRQRAAALMAQRTDTTHTRPQERMADYQLRSEFYAGTGQWQKAYEYQQRAQAMEDTIRAQNVRMYNKALQARYARDAEVSRLRAEVSRHELLTRITTIIVVFSVVVALLLGALLVVSRRLARSREEGMMRRLVTLRMENARSRISPHFIYNAINHALAQDSASRGRLIRLVRLMRRQQVMADQLVDTLAEELAFIDDYVAIQQEGMASPLDFQTEVQPDIDPAQMMLPSMTLHIFVENAFKHGFAPLPREEVRILRIKVTRRNDAYIAEVCNNSAPDTPPSTDSTHVGLRIVSATLQQLNEGNPHHITFQLFPWTDNPQQSGCMARLTIPYSFQFKETL